VVEICDTVGAGDAFTAAMAMGLLAGWPLDEINRRANAVAAFVCTQPGATPDLPDDLRAPFLSLEF
jgi:fructokinase